MKILKIIHRFLKSQWLLVASVVGIIVGCTVGLLMNKYNVGFYWFMWLGLPGELFLRALQMAIIPVIVSNLVVVAAKTNPIQQGKVICIIIIYSFSMAIIGSYMGIGLTYLIKPGVMKNNSTSSNDSFSKSSIKQKGLGLHEMLSDLLRNIVPNNLIRECLSTTVSKTGITMDSEGKQTYHLTSEYSQKPNLLGLMTASILFGIFCGQKLQQTQPLIDLCEAVSTVATDVLRLLIRTMPVGVCSLMISSVSGLGPLTGILYSMGLFTLCVLTALAVIHILIHPFVYWIVVRRNPLRLIMALFRPWMTAFTLTSSLMTFPVLQTSLIEFGLKERLVKMVLPLSIGVGSVGSITFVSASCMFIAQLQGHSLSIVSMIALGILSPINVIALPAVPSASLMGVIVLLESLQSSAFLVPLLFATEFILDRFRTGTNIITIGICCAIVDNLSAKNKRRKISTKNSTKSISEKSKPEIIDAELLTQNTSNTTRC